MPPLAPNLSSQPSISQTAITIRDWIKKQSSESGNNWDVGVVSNLRDMWRQAAINSDRLRILICFGGATSRGNFGDIGPWHREDREWLVAITHGRGFTADRGDTLTGSDNNQDSFYDDVEFVRDTCRRLLCISQEKPTIDYRGLTPMQLGNMVIDGYLLKFTVAADIPLITNQPQG